MALGAPRKFASFKKISAALLLTSQLGLQKRMGIPQNRIKIWDIPIINA